MEKEKKERRDNIVIKRLKIEDRVTNKKMEGFIKEELGKEDVKVKRCRKSGKVIEVSLEREKMKKGIMNNIVQKLEITFAYYNFLTSSRFYN